VWTWIITKSGVGYENGLAGRRTDHTVSSLQASSVYMATIENIFAIIVCLEIKSREMHEIEGILTFVV
jgi:hypothetical protein